MTIATPDFDVRVMPHVDGFALMVRISTADGMFSSVVSVPSAGDSCAITHTYAGKTYEIVINLLADGSAAAKLDIREGDKVLTTIARNFSGPIWVGQHWLAPGARHAGDDRNITPPKPRSWVEPVYTAEAKEKRIAGIVILEITIEEDGTVGDVRVLKRLPFGLDKAAVDAVRQWRWEPATLDGKPVPVIFNLTMNFRLE